jgi:hypothetical protein
MNVIVLLKSCNMKDLQEYKKCKRVKNHRTDKEKHTSHNARHVNPTRWEKSDSIQRGTISAKQ